MCQMGYNAARKGMKRVLFILVLAYCWTVLQSSTSINSQTQNHQKDTTERLAVTLSDNCDYELYVDESVGMWYLKLKNYCDEMLICTCKYRIYYQDDSSKTFTTTQRIRGRSETVITSGYSDRTTCEAISVSAKFADD